MENDTTETDNVHPLQNYITQLMPFLGLINAFVLNLLTALSIYLVTSSAFAIHDILGMIVLFFAVIIALLLVAITRPIKGKKIIIRQPNGEESPLDSFTPLYLLLVVSGFIQTIFWVLDSDNSAHEPRSVFIIATAGIIAYFRQQYRQTLHTE